MQYHSKHDDLWSYFFSFLIERSNRFELVLAVSMVFAILFPTHVIVGLIRRCYRWLITYWCLLLDLMVISVVYVTVIDDISMTELFLNSWLSATAMRRHDTIYCFSIMVWMLDLQLYKNIYMHKIVLFCIF